MTKTTISNQADRAFKEENHYEQDLALIRRLDWRFLLPSPKLGVVSYLGPGESGLLSALQQFASEVHRFEAVDQNRNGTEKRYDLLVCTKANWQKMARAGTALKPEGYLYLEYKQAGLFPRAESVQKKLQLAGFCQITAHWHRPNFSRCLYMVPLFEKQALRHFFDRNRSDEKGKAISLLGTVLLRLNLAEGGFSLLTRQ